jgi:hypothetical protein
MGPELRAALDRANAAYAAMTPEQKTAMWRAQAKSWIRAMAPCEHGDPDWETCPQCRGWDRG